ncbi:MAG: hypothetical protein KAS94_03900 [Desulfobulbaceae bacterium]|nr:hypothetical protein [Desulfobulbaceae bacterium]
MFGYAELLREPKQALEKRLKQENKIMACARRFATSPPVTSGRVGKDNLLLSNKRAADVSSAALFSGY